MKNYYITLALLFVITLTAFAQKDFKFDGTKWVLVSIDGKKIDYKDSVRKAYVIFNEKDLLAEGFSGCNGFSVDFYISGEILKFDAPTATMRGCPNSNIEDAFFGVLARTNSYLIEGKKLTLYQMGDAIATFEPVCEPQKETFSGAKR